MWIDTVLEKRWAQLSSVCLCETSDPIRCRELMEYAKAQFRDEHVKRVLIFEGWRGLTQLVERNGKLYEEAVTLEDEWQGDQEAITGLTPALRLIDGVIRNKNEATMVIMTNLPEDDYGVLRQALKSWATDDYLFNNRSSLWVLDADPSGLVGDRALDLCIFESIPLSSEDEREKIISGVEFIPEEDVGRIIKVTSGLTLHEVESAICLAAARLSTNEQTLEDGILDFKVGSVAKKGARLIVSSFGFEGVGGMKQLKDDFEYRVKFFYKNPKAQKAFDIDPPRGMLLFGPPGTGKSYFAKALGKELNLPVISFNLGDLMSKWVGDSDKQLNRILKIIDAFKDIIVFMDEVESVAARQVMEGDGGTASRMLSKLLAWMGDENRRAYVVAATNLPQNLREAFIRVGRFDRILPVMYPDRESREQILEVHLTGLKDRNPAPSVDLSAIAAQTELWNCGELAYLVSEAAVIAAHDQTQTLEQEHLLKAMGNIRINMQERARQLAEYSELASRFCNDARYLEEFQVLQDRPELKSRLELIKPGDLQAV